MPLERGAMSERITILEWAAKVGVDRTLAYKWLLAGHLETASKPIPATVDANQQPPKLKRGRPPQKERAQ
jgi:hypothetical protein